MARLDTKQVADRLGVSYVVAAGLVKHLVATGQATLVEKRKAESGLGKPTRIYELADSVNLSLAATATAPVVEADEADVADAA
jgi:hypothetical protein